MSDNNNSYLDNFIYYEDSNIDYDEVMSENEGILLESYIEQYGEQYRDLIISRYKKIKYCFYNNPCIYGTYPENVKPFFLDEINSNLGHNLTNECFKKLGINYHIVIKDGKFEFHSDIPNKILNYLFPPNTQICDKNCDDINLDGLSFYRKIQLEMWIGKNIDEIIKIVKEYKEIYKEKCQDNNNKYKSLYTDELIKQGRIDSSILREYIVNGFDPTQFNYSKSIINQFNNFSSIASTAMEKTITGNYSPVVYIPSSFRIKEYLDIILDHETRHALEMTQIKGEKENEYYVKSGLSLTKFVNEEVVNNELDFLNEIMTQKMSIENTHKRYEKGQFIFTPKGLVVPYQTTGYDKYIPIFDELIDKDLYEILLAARMDESLDDLYKKVPQKKLIKIENDIKKAIK